MKRTRKIVLALIAAASIGAMASSYATGMGMGPGGGCAMSGKKMANPAQIDSKLAEMKKILKIGSAQEGAWTTFAKIMKQQKTEMMSAMQEKMQQRTSKVQPAQAAPDRIGERIQFMKQRVAGMETAAAAMKQLYAILTPQQKEILDARFGQDMPM
ncbi:MAG: Spy/CpxP family protein refolding chaperone [Gallionellaceae bacterium]|nr:Spy/CpxP family protein refolding chaperone [Gallionellaceae bacterium]